MKLLNSDMNSVENNIHFKVQEAKKKKWTELLDLSKPSYKASVLRIVIYITTYVCVFMYMQI